MRWLPSPLLLLFYAALMLLVLEDFRGVMGDEAAYADPALRWCEGRGFTSAAWWQSPDAFWAANVPLYAVINAAWVKFTGMSSLWGLRSLSLLLYVAGLALWMAACRRVGWFKSVAQEVVFLAMILGSLYATAPSQYIRPEAVAPLLLGLGLWGQTLSREAMRDVMAFATGALAAWAGFQFAVTLGVLVIVWVAAADAKPWRAFVSCILGGVTGFGVLVAVYAYFGVLGVFVESTFGHGGNRLAQWHGLRDPMLWAGSAVLATGLALRLWAVREQRWALAGLAAGPGLAGVLFLLSKFPQYYGFLAVLPVCTATAAVFPALRKNWRLAAGSILALAGLSGFPLAALTNWNAMPSRNHEELSRWAAERLTGCKTAYVDPSAYFAARGQGRQIYTQFVLPALTTGERSRIDAVMLIPGHPLGYLQKESVLQLLGGEWELDGTYPENSTGPSRFPALDIFRRFSYAGPYQFELWRRVQ